MTARAARLAAGRAAAALLAGAAAAALFAGRPVRGSEVAVVADVAYDAGAGNSSVRRRLDLYVPTDRRDYPLVIFVHGGAWRGGDKQAVPGVLYDNVGRALAARGIGVALINHRLSDGGPENVRHPAHAEDVAMAVGFSRAWLNAAGIAPINVFLLGHEAGAHLASLVATDARYLAARGLSRADVRGVVGLAGIYDVRDAGAGLDDVFGSDPAVRREASPIVHASAAAPPHLLLYGSDDRMGRAGEAERFAAALGAAGGRARAEALPRYDHWTIVARFGDAGDVVVDRVVAFVSQNARPSPSATPTHTPVPTVRIGATPTSAPVGGPGQPESGPGGRRRPHGGVREIVDDASPSRFRLRLPIAPSPASSALLVFVTADGAVDDASYDAWLDHCARGGVIVATVAAGGAASSGVSWSRAATAALAAAWSRLETDAQTEPDPRRVVYAGHGAGALAAGALAAEWGVRRSPAPRGLFMAMPRRGAGVGVPALRRLPRDTRVLWLEGGEAGRDAGLEAELWAALADLPGAWREQIVMASDRHGVPGLVADFDAVLSDPPQERLDALDWYGSWKWLAALTSCAIDGEACAYAFGGGEAQRDMGAWADGHSVQRPEVLAAPPRPDARSRLLPWAHAR